MINIINSANETLAIIDNTSSAEISEEINGAFTFNFTAAIDGTKSAEIYHGHKVEVEDNYFNIMKTYKKRTASSLMISAVCEHVSYDMVRANFTAGFTATGLFSAVATTLISAINTAITANFTLGTVEITAAETISINESVTGRSILLQLAALYDGELEFNKYSISLLTRRGADNGVQFRYRKNISEASVTVDYQTLKDDGSPTVSYEVSAAELEFEQNYIDKGYANLEHYELGDTIYTFDDDLDLENASARIVKYSYNPLQRIQGTVVIGDYVNDLTNTIKTLTTSKVTKDGVYNGTSIGPDNGFVAERSDQLVKTEMNATNGIEIDLRTSTTASYTPVFYVTVDTAAGTANLYLAGDAILTGKVAIGTGNSIFKADSNGIYLGNATFGSAPFRVTMSGSATASDLTLTGGRFNVGTGTNTLQFNTTDGLFLGNTAVASAPFRVTMSGAVTASNLNMTGGSITAGDITVTSNVTVGNNIYLGASTASISKALVFASGASFYTYEDFVGWTGLGIVASSINLGTDEIYADSMISMYGSYDFEDGVTGTIRTTAVQTITVTNGLITGIA